MNYLRRKIHRHITPADLPQNLLFDDFAAQWIYPLAPSARRILSEG